METIKTPVNVQWWEYHHNCCHKDLIENLENMIIGNFEYFSLKQGKLLKGIVIWFVKREGIESFKRVSSLLFFSVTCLSTPQDSPFGIFFPNHFSFHKNCRRSTKILAKWHFHFSRSDFSNYFLPSLFLTNF